MSADNWAVCPKCLGVAMEAWAKKLMAVQNSYGVAPPEEYMANLKEASNQPDPETFRTFREDYEVGLIDGLNLNRAAGPMFFVSYSGGCRECGFGHTYNHEEPI